ncbi:threonine dehydrogenase-like Zn-dependent dehydrogenase [Rhodoligotrophos appendicifer]|uniref:zinc-dependent alcohol dehydrogenase n=1 Tax=Rhodoligotrophos appendicifer TaxID=987056 RepID=UPI001FE501CA|nr:zinc-binding alcohol dehydrogenase [Rhodoligotrophos appendicifer]
MRAPFQEGTFEFPLKYGYSAVGVVEEGPKDFVGKIVFCLYPHQDRFRVSRDEVVLVPPHIDPKRAVLTANMETALNIIWDSGLGVGDRIIIVGGGVVGLLLAFIASQMPATTVTVIDIDLTRERFCQGLGVEFGVPIQTFDEADVVVHTSATQAGAQFCLEVAGAGARVIEASWFGDESVCLPLGRAFHSKRLQLVSSQVGKLPASHSSRWTFRRRLGVAIDLLDDSRLDSIITAEVPFRDLPNAMPGLLAKGAAGLMTAVSY